jgi:hypothetical protein
MAKRKNKPTDPDLETWAKLGGGVTASEAEQMSEGEKIVQEANEIARSWLDPSTWRPQTPNPLRRG